MSVMLINDASAPSPNGHYSQAACIGDLILISAQLPAIERGSSLRNPNDWIVAQTNAVLEHLLNITKYAGGNLGTIIFVRIYIANIENWDAINRVYESFMGSHKPARAVVNVSKIKSGFDVMMEATATVAKE